MPAPVTDGVPCSVLTIAPRVLNTRVTAFSDRCLQSRTVRKNWMIVKLALICKSGKRRNDSPSLYRLICLFDELRKQFERIVARSILSHQSLDDPDVPDSHCGFRKERSTIDAVSGFVSTAQEIVSQGGAGGVHSHRQCLQLIFPEHH